MHEHDLDLIAEHASGLLAEADAARAAELVETCETCAAEYHDQRSIRTLLAAAPAPVLTEIERQRLRRSVLDAAAPPTPVRGWQRRFLPLMGAAAAMLVAVVGIGIVGSIGGQDGGMTLADGGESAATTTQAADALIPPQDEPTFDIAADEAEEAAGVLSDDATAQQARSAGLLVDAVGADLDSVLAELTAVVAETSDVVVLDDAVAFGLTCAPLIEEPILAGLSTEIDGIPTQVFLTGDRVEPVVTFLRSPECTP